MIPFSTHPMDIRWSPVHLMAYCCFAPESDLEFRINSIIEIVGYDKHGWTALPLNSSSGFPRCNKNQPTNFLGHRLESLPPPTFLKSRYSSNKNPRKDSDLMTCMTHEIPDIYHKNQRNGGKNQRNARKYTIHGSYYVWFCLVGCRWILTKMVGKLTCLRRKHLPIHTVTSFDLGSENCWKVHPGRLTAGTSKFTQLKRKTIWTKPPWGHVPC